MRESVPKIDTRNGELNMGAQYASELARFVTDEGLRLDVALLAHFQGNHYPPIPSSCVNSAIAAIDAADSGAWDSEIDLPRGVSWRGRHSAPARAIIEGWHLKEFLAIYSDD